ncbi:MAG TPA: enoyl-CoA hydratase/isomerase family protein [Acidimicrobiales bacterium]|nr:enoyl-CoA hydratase/isomerase family protein [Acidimicrobiales bacterium]
MGSEPFVTVDRRDDGVAVVRLDRPRANALSLAVLDQLGQAAHALAGDPPGAVVVWGGPRIFAAGADISEFTEPGAPDRLRSAAAREVAAAFRAALDALAALPRAVIAAVNGYALGGGCELALACDFRVAGDTARLGQPEVLLGIIPGGGGTQRLARLVGPARAKELVFSGRQVGSAEALAMGLVDRVVPSDQVLEAALAWAAELAGGAVAAQGLAKQAVDGGASRPLAEALDLEADLFARSFATDDAAVGVRSFLEHGPGAARFSGA